MRAKSNPKGKTTDADKTILFLISNPGANLRCRFVTNRAEKKVESTHSLESVLLVDIMKKCSDSYYVGTEYIKLTSLK